jgi:non-canonical purine NTP pyrophosphatase (RdgB/HAM1 family)
LHKADSSRRLVIATRNHGKLLEIRTLLGDVPWSLVTLDQFENVGEAEENEGTYIGNAISKAKFYASATGEIVMADDSGLEVTALAGAPGVLSARYAGPNASDEVRRVKLLSELKSASSSDRSARFVCAAVMANPEGEVLQLAEGICEGSICFDEHGESGFGYDPIFVPDGYHQTFGELSEEVKNSISHRAIALQKMRQFLIG